jgi:tetratricopeptide (TPR) repeat protein
MMDSRRWKIDAHRMAVVYRLLFVVFLLSTSAHSLFAEWYKDYESAIDLIRKGNFNDAAPKLKSAISQKHEEGANIKFYGMKFADYFPHYYLGLCYFNEKDFPSAVREFEQSERYGAIQKKSDLSAKLASLKTLSLAQLSVKTPPTVAENNPPFQPPIVTQQQNTTQPPPLTVQNQKPVEPATTKPLTGKQQSTTGPPIEKPAVNIDAEAARVMIKKGAQKYFEGDYDGAISLLSSAIEASPNSASSYFLLGCSYAARYLLSGSASQEDFKNATQAFQKIRKLDPNYHLRNGSYFSPAILEIYAKTS